LREKSDTAAQSDQIVSGFNCRPSESQPATAREGQKGEKLQQSALARSVGAGHSVESVLFQSQSRQVEGETIAEFLSDGA
jgi:hypothetical protein